MFFLIVLFFLILLSCGTHSTFFSRSQSSDMNIEMSIEARGIIDLHLSSELRKKKIDLEVCTILFLFHLLSLLYTFHLTSRRKKQVPVRKIKQNLDSKFGKYWHVCIGEGFSYDVTHQKKSSLLVYYHHEGKGLGVLVFKA